MVEGTEQTTGGAVKVGDYVKWDSVLCESVDGKTLRVSRVDGGRFFHEESGPAGWYMDGGGYTVVPDPNATPDTEPGAVQDEKGTSGNEPAYPEPFVYDKDRGVNGEYVSGEDAGSHTGLTIRQLAAIKMRVPLSGTPWLDEMIQQSRRDVFAAQAMSSIITSDFAGFPGKYGAGEEASFFELAAGIASTEAEVVAWRACVTADAMIAALDNGGAE